MNKLVDEIKRLRDDCQKIIDEDKVNIDVPMTSSNLRLVGRLSAYNYLLQFADQSVTLDDEKIAEELWRKYRVDTGRGYTVPSNNFKDAIQEALSTKGEFSAEDMIIKSFQKVINLASGLAEDDPWYAGKRDAEQILSEANNVLQQFREKKGNSK